jgi:RNA polymerase sigma-70 factor (ECF subfamily)
MGDGYQDLNISELLFKISIDDKEAFEQIYRIYVGRLMNYIKPFVKNSQEETEEILQELFLKVWVHRIKVSKANNLQAYLLRMAKHELINRHVREVRYNALIDSKDETIDDRDTGLEKLVYKEYLQYAERAIEDLSPQRKTIFKMRTQKDMSISEIATKLNITSAAVKKQLYEARDTVKNQLNQNTGWPFMLLAMFLIH